MTKQELEETKSTQEAFEEEVTAELIATKRSLQQEKSKTLESTRKLVDLQQFAELCHLGKRCAAEPVVNVRAIEAEMVMTKDKLATTESNLFNNKKRCNTLLVLRRGI